MISIDDLIYKMNFDVAPVDKSDTTKFYIVRPFDLYYIFKERWSDAMQVLKGNAIAVNFKQDDLNKKKPKNGYKRKR